MFLHHLNHEQAAWFSKMRQEWSHVIQPAARDGYGASEKFPPLILPDQESLNNARLFTLRNGLIEAMVPHGGVGAEVGTQQGYFAKFLLETTLPKELHLFDLEDSHILKANPHLLLSKEVVFHKGDSSSMLSRFEDHYFDWIYIDADHSYEGCLKDATVAVKKIKQGGLIIFNDYTIWSPTECIDYGVPYVVGELIGTYGFKVEGFAFHPFLYNDIALRAP